MSSFTKISDEKVKSKSNRIAESLSRSLLFKILDRLEHGQIVFQQDDKEWSFGAGQPAATIVIHDPLAYRKILFGGSIAAGEAYVDKLWDVDNLTNLIRIIALNTSLLERMEKGLAWIKRPVDLANHYFNANSKTGSKRNILSHYDLGNEMYKSFLDESMMYSSAMYPDADVSLEEAQQHKLEQICKKLNLKPTDSVIEIGSGWGGFAMFAASRYGCHVTTTTISDAQFDEASRRIDAAGLGDKIKLLKQDYRELTGKYDKLVSIEMVEAVGHRFLPVFFKKCGELLKTDGRMVLQAITIADQNYKNYVGTVDFIQRYIFPGGCLLSNRVIAENIAKQTQMVIRHIEDFGLDYARTLEEWRKRFLASYSELEEKGYDETFKRLWDYYFCYCQGGFMERGISVVQLVATGPGNRD